MFASEKPLRKFYRTFTCILCAFLKASTCIFSILTLNIFPIISLWQKFIHTERDPDHKFSTNLQKQKRDFIGVPLTTLECTVSDPRSQVKWYKGDEEIPTNQPDKYLFEKDSIGNHKLIIRKPRKKDSGTYKCRIKNTKHVTKCSLKIVGNVGLLPFCDMLFFVFKCFLHLIKFLSSIPFSCRLMYTIHFYNFY